MMPAVVPNCTMLHYWWNRSNFAFDDDYYYWNDYDDYYDDGDDDEMYDDDQIETRQDGSVYSGPN